MCKIMNILEREADNSGVIYIYRDGEDGHWYAYEQSAFLLSRLMDRHCPLERFVIEDTLWLARMEVNPRLLPSESFVSVSADECVMHYTPLSGLYGWLEEMNIAWQGRSEEEKTQRIPVC